MSQAQSTAEAREILVDVQDGLLYGQRQVWRSSRERPHLECVVKLHDKWVVHRLLRKSAWITWLGNMRWLTTNPMRWLTEHPVAREHAVAHIEWAVHSPLRKSRKKRGVSEDANKGKGKLRGGSQSR